MKVWAIIKHINPEKEKYCEESFDVSDFSRAEIEINDIVERCWNDNLRPHEHPRKFIRLGRLWDDKEILFKSYEDDDCEDYSAREKLERDINLYESLDYLPEPQPKYFKSLKDKKRYMIPNYYRKLEEDILLAFKELNLITEDSFKSLKTQTEIKTKFIKENKETILDVTEIPKIELDENYGWMDKNGKTYLCEYGKHDDYAEDVLKSKTGELEMSGWVRMWGKQGYAFEGDFLTQKQFDKLFELGFEIWEHHKEFPDYN